MQMACRNGKHLLTTTELANLVTLCPTDDEVKAVKGFKGDVKRLGQVRERPHSWERCMCHYHGTDTPHQHSRARLQAEQFMLAVADVPMARARAQGLVYQAGFDERIKEAYARIRLFTTALEQIKGAARLQRLLKAVLVLGNKMNGVTKKNKKQLVKAFTINSLHQLYLVRHSARSNRRCLRCLPAAPSRPHASSPTSSRADQGVRPANERAAVPHQAAQAQRPRPAAPLQGQRVWLQAADCRVVLALLTF